MLRLSKNRFDLDNNKKISKLEKQKEEKKNLDTTQKNKDVAKINALKIVK